MVWLSIQKTHKQTNTVVEVRDVTNISSCWVNTTSRREIKQLGISFGSIFFCFPMKVAGSMFLVARGNPWSLLLMTALSSCLKICSNDIV